MSRKRPRLDIAAMAEIAKKMTEEDTAAAARELQHKAIADTSIKQYRSAMNTLNRFVTQMKQERLTKSLFIQFLQGLLETRRGGTNTPAQILSAVRHFQTIDRTWLLPGEPIWSLDEDLTVMTVGLGYLGKKKKEGPVTGAMTDAMLKQLCEYCEEKSTEADDLKKLIPAYIIAHSAALRVSQVATLKTNCLIEDDGAFFLVVQKDKRVRASSRKGEVHLKSITRKGGLFVKELTRGRTEKDEYLFDPKDWKYKKLLETLQQAAVDLKWPSDLTWCFHSTRHGGSGTIAKKITEKAISQTLQMSSNMVRKYTKPNALRRNVQGQQGDNQARTHVLIPKRAKKEIEKVKKKGKRK